MHTVALKNLRLFVTVGLLVLGSTFVQAHIYAALVYEGEPNPTIAYDASSNLSFKYPGLAWGPTMDP